MANTEHWAPTPPPTNSLQPPSLPPPLPGQYPPPQAAPPASQPLPDFAPGDRKNVAIASAAADSLTAALTTFVEASGSHYTALYSETGVRIAHAGPDVKLLGGADEIPALAVGAFFATRELAGRLGETQFEGLYQQGAQRHLYLAPVGASFLLLAVFSPPTNVGIIRLCAADSSTDLVQILDPQPENPTTVPKSTPATGPLPVPITSVFHEKPAAEVTESPPATQHSPPPLSFAQPSLSRPAPTGQLRQDTPPSTSWLFRALPAPEAPSSAPTIAGFQGGYHSKKP